ncbi:sensor histidine kinase [Streptomyces pinistramenti]|uniref:sensor histidine kinase n=1 Tax=Streptomyces pinistramenti TaxID=2884812 RepID=UPI001D067B42|nr:sensor histidine kinase [Streptomyces pinistramenti]MCB5907122.1 sensor histidine kinase [Streptomyces pinistramenti]
MTVQNTQRRRTAGCRSGNGEWPVRSLPPGQDGSTAAAGTGRAKGPGRYTFLPWLLMGLGAFSNIIQGRSGNPWLAGAGLLAFNSLYISVVFSSFDPRRRDSRYPLYALGGLAAVTYAVALGFGGNWFLFFPLLSLASGTVRKLRGRKLALWLITLSGSAGYLSGHHGGAPGDAFGIGYGTFLSGMVTAAVLSLFDTINELDATRQELARSAVEKERLRFSRDLHDLLGHTLSVVVVKAEAVRRLAPRNLDAALVQAADIEAVGRQALTEIREAVSGYREGSLTTELDRARSMLEAAGIAPSVRQSGPPLPPQTGALLGWVVREGVTNTVRHSGATHCEIEVRTDGDRARLTVTDDGRGPAQPGTGADGPPGGSGLKGLGERLATAGGTLETGPDGRRGFRLTAELPAGTDEADAADETVRAADVET